MMKTQGAKILAGGSFKTARRSLLVLALALSATQVSMVASSAVATPAACKKVFTEVFNADKTYIALQYGVVQAAKDFVASNSFTTRTNYNDSYVSAIRASNAELNLFIKYPKCYPTSNMSQARKSIKANLVAIANIFKQNVNGQVVGDPQKMTAFKPIGLLK